MRAGAAAAPVVVEGAGAAVWDAAKRASSEAKPGIRMLWLRSDKKIISISKSENSEESDGWRPYPDAVASL